MSMSKVVILKEATAAVWLSRNPRVKTGVMALETDTGKAKMGHDDVSRFNDLEYVGGSGGSDVASVFGTATWDEDNPGTLLLASNLAVPYLLRNDGRPRLAMVLVSGGALLNILLNYIMVGRLGLGLTGTAQATLLSEAMVSLLGLGYFFTRHARLRLTWRFT